MIYAQRLARALAHSGCSVNIIRVSFLQEWMLEIHRHTGQMPPYRKFRISNQWEIKSLGQGKLLSGEFLEVASARALIPTRRQVSGSSLCVGLLGKLLLSF